ncbi:TlpA family protein disulfide reductase [Pontiella sp.]|uniref:TlpA family protein disulfide reductase n=1 Tax=Pontiella sp. TaxID=2837462 RepID=UPI00356610AC
MMKRYGITPTIGSALAALLLSGCGPSKPAAQPATPSEIGRRIAQSTAPLTLVHVWATWCDPCRAEFPELVKIMEHYQSMDVVLVSADAPADKEAVEAFLAEHGSPQGSLITTELTQAFIESLSPKWGGALPASFFFQDGKIVREWEGKRTHDEYAETIETLLNK